MKMCVSLVADKNVYLCMCVGLSRKDWAKLENEYENAKLFTSADRESRGPQAHGSVCALQSSLNEFWSCTESILT